MAASLMCSMDETPKKHGIVSILCSDTCGSATSLRRTLSADMSSKKWLSENGLSPTIKRVASSEDIWSWIMSQNAKHHDTTCAPYVHPLVRRSSSLLSKKSLEVCTESLGSETGSDGFSEEEKIVREVNYDFTPVIKKLGTPTCFPPPLPSRGEGHSLLRVRPHRENGRLLMEAVSVASGENNFKAERHDGRLVLTLLKQEKINEGAHRLALAMGPTWVHNFNQLVKFESRPSRPPKFNIENLTNEATTRSLSSFNAYDYCWRSKFTTAQVIEKISGSTYIISKINRSMIITNNYQNQEDYTVKGCKEHQISLFREPYRIAMA